MSISCIRNGYLTNTFEEAVREDLPAYSLEATEPSRRGRLLIVSAFVQPDGRRRRRRPRGRHRSVGRSARGRVRDHGDHVAEVALRMLVRMALAVQAPAPLGGNAGVQRGGGGGRRRQRHHGSSSGNAAAAIGSLCGDVHGDIFLSPHAPRKKKQANCFPPPNSSLCSGFLGSDGDSSAAIPAPPPPRKQRELSRPGGGGGSPAAISTTIASKEDFAFQLFYCSFSCPQAPILGTIALLRRQRKEEGGPRRRKTD